MIVLLIPIVALLLALAWSAWTSRPPRRLSPEASVEAHRRVLRALAPDRSGREAGHRERRRDRSAQYAEHR